MSNSTTQPADAFAALIGPIAEQAATAAVAKMLTEANRLPSDRLGFPEAEAAALLGVPRHVLRDCRLRGEICARLVGKKNIYSRESLVKFLAAK